MRRFLVVAAVLIPMTVTSILLSIALPVSSQSVGVRSTSIFNPTFAGNITTTGRVTAGTSIESMYGLHATSLTKPVNGTHTLGTGTLSNGTYYYRVAAYNAGGITDASTETSFTISTGPAGVNVVWGTVTGADGYKVYCRTTGAEQLCATVVGGGTLTWLDNGSVTPSGALPGYTYGAILVDAPGVGSQLPFLMRYAGAAKCYLGIDGAWSCKSYQADNGWFQTNANNVTLHLQGNATNGASAVGVKSSNAASLTTDGAEIHTFYSDNETTKRAAITKDGGIQLGVGAGTAPTCDAAHRGTFNYQGGAAGVKDVAQVCAKDASDVYAWRAIY